MLQVRLWPDRRRVAGSGSSPGDPLLLSPQIRLEREEAEPQGLVRTVRSVVWRRVTADGEAEIIPIVRWEVLDYVPFAVRDFPEDRLRRR